jgi:hypothetical protein
MAKITKEERAACKDLPSLIALAKYKGVNVGWAFRVDASRKNYKPKPRKAEVIVPKVFQYKD